MGKYAISKSFYPYALFAPPIRSAKMASWMGKLMRVPGRVFRDRAVEVRRERIAGYQGGAIDLLVMTPKGCAGKLPCMVYFHGGGFLFPAAGYHYDLALRYARETPCQVVFVHYRLTPQHPFPIPAEDCYAALLWTLQNTEWLGADPSAIGVGGDSAGGALAAAVAQMARDRLGKKLRFQLLVYPVTDRRMDTPSNRRFTDTPMWNSKLSVKMWAAYLPHGVPEQAAYASPMEAACFADLPDAYVETAEFDCLHDEGIAYALALRSGGAEVEIYETRGTMHGFDTVQKAPETQAAVRRRIDFLTRMTQ